VILIDGSEGEGGGQILRSSLALSICTQQPFRIEKIRANREKPGLMRQHLTAVKAAAEICGAEVEGAELGSNALTFRPSTLKGGQYSFAIGTAGSCTLVLQTVLPALLTAPTASTVRISGGTHNRGSPPFDFLQRAFLPLMARMGANVAIDLTRYGFFPRGGGEIRVEIAPVTQWSRLDLHDRGIRTSAFAESYIAAIPLHVAQRELEVIGRMLNWPQEQRHVRGLSNDLGPGNAVTITIAHEHVTEVFTGFGERGVRAEEVGETAAREARAYIAHAAPVGEHLADQLLLPMALAGGGSFTCTEITPHLRSNALVIERFTDTRTRIEASGTGMRVEVSQ
jgi:RNA 3'-terminal phosphate cyclase (ATP)